MRWWYASIKVPLRAGGGGAFPAELLRLTLLAPDVVEAVLDGRLPKGLKLEDLVRPLPSAWAEQRRVPLDRARG